jgi:hypothetical protein
MNNGPDTIDISRAVAYAHYVEALKSGEEAKRKAALSEITELHQKKVARLIKELQS